MKRIRDLARLAGDAARQLTLPLLDTTLVPPATHGRRRVAYLCGERVDYELRRSRRRSIGFVVDATGLRVTAPRWVTLADIESALRDKERWIVRKLVEWREHARRRERLTVDWRDGAAIPYIGRTLTLRLDPTVDGTRLRGAQLWVGLPPRAEREQLQHAVQAWLQQQARELFEQRVPQYAQRLGRRPKRLMLSSARTRWGSCGADGTIRLNWRLIHFPLDVIDYVIVHELAHLKELNHSPKFWATVQSLLPGFEDARQRLREYPDDITVS
ncbi:MAG TPA: SprT family zinc-dependent metalloprotease [Burkholderiaceae bacterium]|jgi:predicted metal-dependent hydrolase|nr:SprT family zinc-dependent metalloprotease [Burkholderiaceae bacterium]